jgi:proteasome accessory factor C
VSAEQWHPDQSFEWLPGGRYRLRVPYARSEELVADLMRHGAAVEVLGPPALRAAVARALKGAAEIYET